MHTRLCRVARGRRAGSGYSTSSALVVLLFPVRYAPESLLGDAPWIFRGGPVELPVALEECWAVISDDANTPYWLPEVQNIRNTEPPDEPAGLFSRRQVDLNFFHTNLLLFLMLAGAVRVDEHVDVWEADSATTRRWSLYFAATARPPFAFVQQARDEFRCDALNGTATAFTFTAAQEPGFLARLFGFIVRPALAQTFEVLAPARLLRAIEEGTLPTLSRL